MSESQRGMALPIEWHFPDGIISRYATNLIVQHTPHEFIISFFEVVPPLILAQKEEEVQAQLAELGAVQAECVARVVVAADRMADFVNALQGNLEQYNRLFGAKGKASATDDE